MNSNTKMRQACCFPQVREMESIVISIDFLKYDSRQPTSWGKYRNTAYFSKIG